ncbi:MAG: phenylacetate--CoA ligase family protein [Lachnospiraceae bacterium]|nr:phenylacetate--CoA ligase family protein [Lachnospiraceae bacterium]
MFDKIKDLMLSAEGIFYCKFFLMRSCKFSRGKIEDYQKRKLKKLLKICQNQIPYYRQLFHKINFDVDRDFKELKDIEKIPLTRKEDVRKYHSQFINPKYKTKALIQQTSGSTGNPLEVLVSKQQWIMEQATVWRQWKWAGYRFRDRMAIVRSYAPKNERAKKIIKYDKIRNFIYYSPYDMTDSNMEKYLNHMIKNKVKFLRGYPSSLELLADYVTKSGHKIPKLKGIFTASEVLSDDTRRKIEGAFEAKISNYYGMAECIVAAGDCGKHQGLHVFEEYGYMEFLETGDASQKKIVGTNLNNYAMPLLRYETNDLAEIASNEISCGHSFRTIKNVIGRNNMAIKLKDRNIPLTNFYTIMEHYPTVFSWQIVQHGMDRVELIIERRVNDEIKFKLQEEFVSRLPKNIEFFISNGKEAIRSGEGKKLAFVRCEK